jgi:glycosyltransferase involved in cell wall biosynthesis
MAETPSKSASQIPTVSIGMPVYNGESYIREALDSLLAQTFSDFELLISDNASTDGTQAICETYARKDRRIRYVRQNNNLGAGRNFEYVLDHAHGKYFMWAAHDDMWASNWLEILVPELGEYDFSVRGTIRYLKGSKIIIERQPPNYKKGDLVRCFMAEETTMNARNFYIYGLFHRHKIIALDRFFLTYEYSPDFILTFKMLEQGNLRCVNSTYQIYRFHDGNGGTKLITSSLGLARLIYKVHPLSYYLKYISIAPPHIKPVIIILIPIKHIHNQARLWLRGLKKIILKLENI